jgi:hypothetical protein
MGRMGVLTAHCARVEDVVEGRIFESNSSIRIVEGFVQSKVEYIGEGQQFAQKKS